MTFVADQNVARFRKLLETEEDAAKRAVLKQLLRDELAKSSVVVRRASRGERELPRIPASER